MIEFVNQETRLEISPANGVISSVTVNGKSSASSEHAFRVRLMTDYGDTVMLDERDFQDFSFDGKEVFHWRRSKTFPGLEVTLKITPAEHGAFRFRPSLSGRPDGWRLEFLSAPLLKFPLNYDLLLPQSEGALYQYADAIGESWEEHFFFPGYSNYYPGKCQMQFLAAYSDNAGIYLSADDYGHAIKFLGTTHRAREKEFEAYIECCCGTDDPGAEYELPFDLILRPFSGDWQHACEIYREWIEQDPLTKREFSLPGWIDESPVVIIYPVRGERGITDNLNKFIPYENTFPRIQELAEQFDSKVMVLLMRWDHNGPWLPPYYWPPAGGAESFRKFRDLLHREGHLLGVYGSGTYFTRKSLTNDYSGEDIFERENLAASMVTSPRGDMDRIFKPIRIAAAFCMSEEAGPRILTEQTMILADEKVDFFQILDQNLGGAPFYCYNKHHHHPSIPGKATTDAMLKFLKELNKKIIASGSSMLLGTECGAAGPFIADMPFNDLRAHFVEGEYMSPVPAYQYIFHRHLNNFFGNSCVVPNSSDEDCMRFRMARGFCGGSMMTVVLRDSGEIDWGASTGEWNCPAPDQKNIVTLVRNMNDARKRYPEFLQKGDMIPAPQIECGTNSFSKLCSSGKVKTVPEILCSAWRTPDGRKASFFVNYMTQEKSFRLNGENITVPPLSVIMMDYE